MSVMLEASGVLKYGVTKGKQASSMAAAIAKQAEQIRGDELWRCCEWEFSSGVYRTK